MTARAPERISTPDFKDEITPEGAHVASSSFGRGGNKENLNGRGRITFERGLGLRLGRSDSRGELARRGKASGLVGVDAVVTDGLLAFGRQVIHDGSNEVGGFEYLEVPFDVMVTF